MLKIKKSQSLRLHKFKVSTTFSFHAVSEDMEKKIVKELTTDIAAAGEIPLKILKES